MIKLELNLTPTEANTLCSIFAMAIDHYTYCVDETVNPKWIWGLMGDLSKAVIESEEK